MKSSILTLLFTAAASVTAIEITSPSKNSLVDISSPFTITWSTVNTDPKSAHLFLVNMAGGNTPFSKDLGEVDLTKGSVTVELDGVKVDGGEGWQFNLQGVEKENKGILAQSGMFDVKGEVEGGKKTETEGGKTSIKGTVTKGTASATATTLESVVVSASATASVSGESSVVSKTAGGGASGATSSGAAATADASSTPESGAGVGSKVGGLLALVAAGVVAVVA